MAVKTTKSKKKIKKNIPTAIVHIYSNFNNTIMTVTDPKGDTITWSSSGAVGFKGAKKSTPYAAQLVSQSVIKTSIENGVKAVSVRIKGMGPGKDAALRQLQASTITVNEIKNVTPHAHNGVKLKKKYRRR